MIGSTAVLIAVCALLGGIGGVLVPAVVRRLPEPRLEPGEEKVPYVELVRWRYLPLVTGVVAAVPAGLAAWRLGPEPILPAVVYLWVLGVALGYVDLRVHRLPNRLVLPSYPVMAVLVTLGALGSGAWGSLLAAAIGAAALWGAFFVLMAIYPAGMGFGDVKLAGLIGAALGWLGAGPTVVGLLAAFVYGGLSGLALIVFRRAGRKSAIPFGPFLLLGFWTAVMVGESLTEWYVGFSTITAP